jgi:hypothetical protein
MTDTNGSERFIRTKPARGQLAGLASGHVEGDLIPQPRPFIPRAQVPVPIDDPAHRMTSYWCERTDCLHVSWDGNHAPSTCQMCGDPVRQWEM